MENAGGPQILVIFGCCVGLIFPAVFLFTLIMALTRKSKGWMIAAVVSGVLALLALIGGVVFGVITGTKAAKEQAMPRAFSTSDGLATVMGASGWRELNLQVGSSTLGIGNELAEEYLLIISEPKTDFPEGFSLNEFAEAAAGQTKDNLEGASAGEMTELTITGRSAFRQELTGSVDGLAIFYLNSYVDGRDHFHQVMTWTLLEKRDASRATLGAAADSFREIETVVP